MGGEKMKIQPSTTQMAFSHEFYIIISKPNPNDMNKRPKKM